MSEKKPVTNVIYIGKKPLMNYVIGAILQFNQGADNVVIKARGKAISRAVDIAEIVKRRFLSGETMVSDIKIGTETVGEGENIRNVSTIEITLKKTS
ncbi:TPA: DNA-binding protein Alba [Candidatus Bathyarchaeota archaeon]|nr:DNA-binding protein Alba [Candidatus Bathyarchaeota archaeon]